MLFTAVKAAIRQSTSEYFTSCYTKSNVQPDISHQTAATKFMEGITKRLQRSLRNKAALTGDVPLEVWQLALQSEKVEQQQMIGGSQRKAR